MDSATEVVGMTLLLLLRFRFGFALCRRIVCVSYTLKGLDKIV